MKQRVVYSTDRGRMCPDCGEPIDKCRCRSVAARPAGDGVVRLQRQVKGRKGKPVVIITGLPLTADELRSLAKTLKAKCGVGGSVEDGNILIQGDQRDRLRTELEALGYNVKISGG